MKKLFLMMLPLVIVACGTKQTEGEEETICVMVERATLTNDYTQLPYVGVVEEESSTSVSFTGMAMLKTISFIRIILIYYLRNKRFHLEEGPHC